VCFCPPTPLPQAVDEEATKRKQEAEDTKANEKGEEPKKVRVGKEGSGPRGPGQGLLSRCWYAPHCSPCGTPWAPLSLVSSSQGQQAIITSY
jgi:hypothetical protein